MKSTLKTNQTKLVDVKVVMGVHGPWVSESVCLSQLHAKVGYRMSSKSIAGFCEFLV